MKASVLFAAEDERKELRTMEAIVSKLRPTIPSLELAKQSLPAAKIVVLLENF